MILTLTLTPGTMLTERGQEALDDAIDKAELATVIHDAVVEALHRELPRERDFEFIEWFTIRVTEEP